MRQKKRPVLFFFLIQKSIHHLRSFPPAHTHPSREWKSAAITSETAGWWRVSVRRWELVTVHGQSWEHTETWTQHTVMTHFLSWKQKGRLLWGRKQWAPPSARCLTHRHLILITYEQHPPSDHVTLCCDNDSNQRMCVIKVRIRSCELPSIFDLLTHWHTTQSHVFVLFYCLAGFRLHSASAFVSSVHHTASELHHIGRNDESPSKAVFNFKLKALLTGWMSFTSSPPPPLSLLSWGLEPAWEESLESFWGWPASHVELKSDGDIVWEVELLNL